MQKPYADRLHQIRGLLRSGDKEAARQQAEAAVAECEAEDLQSLAEVFRGVVCHAKDDFAGATTHFGKALQDPQLDPTGDFWHMWGYTSHKQGDLDRAMECYQETLDTSGGTWYNLGAAYADKGAYDRAIECYQKAIDTPGYDNPGNVWSSMGFAYGEMGDFGRAIECYQKAIHTPGYDDPDWVWNELGDLHAGKGDYDRALECYQKAPDTPGWAWHDLGLAYAGKGDYDQALECYQKAIDTPGYDTPGDAWYNMGLAYARKGDHDRAIECYQKAIDTPGYDTPGDAWNNMGRAYRQKDDYDRAIECYQRALDTPGYDTPGAALNNMGGAYGEKGDHDRAIECYQKALDTPGYDTPGATLSNMGVAYSEKGDHGRALKCFRKAIDTPECDATGTAWYNMGVAYSKKGDYGRAIECHQKAIDSPGYDAPGDAWNNMGLAYSKKGDYDRAFECYQKAIDSPGHDAPGDARNNMGLAYLRKGDRDHAIECFEAALRTPGYEHAGMTHALLRAIGVRSTESVDTIAEMLQDDAADPLLQMRNRVLTSVVDGTNLMDEWADLPASTLDNVLVFLKGWSSSVPWIMASGSARLATPPAEPSDEGCAANTTRDRWPQPASSQLARIRCDMVRGGGYFLKWRSRGSVIDPGGGFIANFLEEGFHTREIHHVLTTHSHLDHTADLLAVQNLVKEYNDSVTRRAEDGSDPDVRSLVHCWDCATHQDARSHIRTTKGEKSPHQLRPDAVVALPDEAGLQVSAEHTGHIPDEDNAVALRIELLNPKGDPCLSIGLSSDASPKAVEDLTKLFDGCGLIILHLSKTHKEDLDEEDGNWKERHHLGFMGCAELIRKTKAQLYVIAEFSAERGDYRHDVTKYLAAKTGTSARVLPADIGLTVHLPDHQGDELKIRCQHCGEWVAVEDIHALRPSQPFGRIRYVCRRCLL